MSAAANEQITEERIKELSVNECLRLRAALQTQLDTFYKTNPAIVSRLLTRINERLFEDHYYLSDANEG